MFDADAVEAVITQGLRQKMQDYSPEAAAKPFQDRLIGRDRLALFSFVQSLNTTFGTKIFEPVALKIASTNGWQASGQTSMGGNISSGAQAVITDIMNNLVTGSTEPDVFAETERIREAAQTGTTVPKKMRKTDIYLERDSTITLIEMKTPKANLDGFEKVKQNLLEWTAATLYKSPSAKVITIAGLPYNPYEPEPYKRWTAKGLFDLREDSQLKVGPELWNFFADGEDVYDELLGCFQRVGERLRAEIDEYFARFTNLG